LHNNFRHRITAMSRFRFRDDESSSTSTIIGVLAGAIGGFALGMYVAQRVGGFEGLTSRFKARKNSGSGEVPHPLDTDDGEFDDIEDDDLEGDEADQGLEERVLEAFRNDPILAERAVDIGSIGLGLIELAGWVDTDHESEHAVTIARGVPGVDTVVNRLSIGSEEARFEENARRAASGDPAYAERHWEGNTIGTGRRRQGSSDELDRHADPKVELETRWSGTADALKQAAEDTDGSAERKRRAAKGSVKGDRTGGSPVAPTGVPKADHVAKPMAAEGQAD
jgi:osmotically-inducible protein OsmY